MLSSDTLTNLIQIAMEGSFYIVTLIFVGFSLSIAYHWFAYGTNKAQSTAMLLVYLGVSAFFFLSMFLALNSI